MSECETDRCRSDPQLVYIAYATVAMDGVVKGATGQHITSGYTADQASKSLLGWYICTVLYAPMTMLIRASVGIVLLRITTSRVFRLIVWLNLGIITVVSTLFCFLEAFQCKPPSFFWRQVYGVEGGCLAKSTIQNIIYAHCVFSAASDWCLGLLPIGILWNVKINKRTKAIIAVLLGLGVM